MEYFTLNNGIKMPMAGIGVFMMSPAEAEASVESALRICSCISPRTTGVRATSRSKRHIKKAK